MFVLLYVFLMISISLSNEEKNSTEKILVSLPFTRKDIVIAKYISTLFFYGIQLNHYIRFLCTTCICIKRKYKYSLVCSIYSYFLFYSVCCYDPSHKI
ncbi:ABC-2 transporter permease [Bacillus cereus]